MFYLHEQRHLAKVMEGNGARTSIGIRKIYISMLPTSTHIFHISFQHGNMDVARTNQKNY